jgi:hypothetical protein
MIFEKKQILEDAKLLLAVTLQTTLMESQFAILVYF